MRAAKNLTLALSLALCVSVPVAGNANESQAKALLKTESLGLATVADKRLKKLAAAPVSAGGVEFTRKWLDAQPTATGDAQWECLAEALYFEARGETVKGQFAVAEVIINRVSHSRFPTTLCGVINQGTGKKYQCQFTYTCDGQAERIHEPRSYARVGKVARVVIDGNAPKLTNGATHYHTTAVNPRWAKVYTVTARIGVHIFYRHNVRSASN